METLLFSLYELMTELIPFLLAFCLIRRKGQRNRFSGADVLLFLFAFYVMAVFRVTGAGTIYEAGRLRPEYIWKRINLIPFSNRIDMIGYLLNVAMLVPFGLLTPLIFCGMDRGGRVTLGGFLFSLLIELSQILSSRGTDVDDLIMNTIGAAVGYGLYCLWRGIVKTGKARYALSALPVCVLAMYFGRCLLYNYLGLIHLVYGI